MKIKPEERFSIPEILAHPWLKGDELEDNTYFGKEECTNPGQVQTEGQPDINEINVDNLFFKDFDNTKLSYTDYCCIANDFYTQHISKFYLALHPNRRRCAKKVRKIRLSSLCCN